MAPTEADVKPYRVMDLVADLATLVNDSTATSGRTIVAGGAELVSFEVLAEAPDGSGAKRFIVMAIEAE